MGVGAARRGVWLLRVRWTVLVGRIAATAVVVLGAVLITTWVSRAHSWNMGGPTVICPAPEEVYPNVEIAEIRVSRSPTDRTWCNYVDTNGIGVGESLTPVGRSERNVFEPRLSFVISAAAIALSWLVALALVRFIWSLGRLVRRPQRVPGAPVAS